MPRVALLLTLEDDDQDAHRTSFAVEETYDPSQASQKHVIGRLLIETLLAMDHEVAGAYPLTCLAEALVYLQNVDDVEPDMTHLIEEAARFLDNWEARVSKLRRMLGAQGDRP